MRQVRFHHLLGSTLVAVAVLAGLNLAIARSAPHLPAQQLLARIDRTAANARFVFLGDSQMEADADPIAFSAGCARPKDYRPSINVGLGYTKASEHCLVLEHLLRRAPAADTVFYGFYDDLMTEPVPNRFRDIGGNRALAFQFPERAAELLFPQDAFSQWRFRLTACVPMVAERLALWARVERLRRFLGAIGLPAVAVSRFGRAADFRAIEPANDVAWEKRLRALPPFNSAVGEIARVCAAKKLKFYLLAMPVPSAHRTRFYARSAWAAYREHINNLTQAQGGRFLDASDWIPDEHFSDPLHAGTTGARIFSMRLAEEICPPESGARTHPVDGYVRLETSR